MDILRVSGVFKGSGSLEELRSPGKVEVKNGHPLECLGWQERHWRRYQHHEQVRVVGHWERAFATFRDLTRTSLGTQWRREASESAEPRLRGLVQSWVDLKLVLLNLWVGASAQGTPHRTCIHK